MWFLLNSRLASGDVALPAEHGGNWPTAGPESQLAQSGEDAGHPPKYPVQRLIGLFPSHGCLMGWFWMINIRIYIIYNHIYIYGDIRFTTSTKKSHFGVAYFRTKPCAMWCGGGLRGWTSKSQAQFELQIVWSCCLLDLSWHVASPFELRPSSPGKLLPLGLEDFFELL